VEVISINQDRLGIQGKPVIIKDKMQVWSKPLANGDIAVAVFNLGLGIVQLIFSTEEIGLKGKCKIKNVWTYADENPYDEFTVNLPPHGTKFLRITPITN